MAYCIRSDLTGIVILPVVYLIILLGNAAYLILVFAPKVRSYIFSGLGVKYFPAGNLIELIFYELCSFFMVWSHLATMCVQPGFIPRNYTYNDEKLPISYKIALNKEIMVRVPTESDMGRPKANSEKAPHPDNISEKSMAYLDKES